MRKINDLCGDEFFDFVLALSPVLPSLGELEILQMQFSGANPILSESRRIIAREKASKKPNLRAIDEAQQRQGQETTAVFVRDIAKIVPLLCKNHRSAVYEVISILDQASIAEVKKYPGPKLTSKLVSIFKDADFKSFLSPAESSATTDS